MARKKSYNPCDDCRYGYSKQNQESGTCKNCEFKKYLNAEEQGLLLRLPCKIGDTVFVIGSRCLANDVLGAECLKNDCNYCLYDKEKIVFEIEVQLWLLEHLILNECENWMLNKTVFLTKEEAEQALARMEGGNE